MKKFFRGSALVYTLIMMMLLLVTALSLATTTLIQQRGATGTAESVQAFQLANDGFEDITARYTKGGASDLNEVGSCSVSDGVATVTNNIVTGTYSATFKDSDGNYINNCGESLSSIAEVKIIATKVSSTRAIETAFAAGSGKYQTSCTAYGATGMACVRTNTEIGDTQCKFRTDITSAVGNWTDCRPAVLGF